MTVSCQIGYIFPANWATFNYIRLEICRIYQQLAVLLLVVAKLKLDILVLTIPILILLGIAFQLKSRGKVY